MKIARIAPPIVHQAGGLGIVRAAVQLDELMVTDFDVRDRRLTGIGDFKRLFKTESAIKLPRLGDIANAKRNMRNAGEGGRKARQSEVCGESIAYFFQRRTQARDIFLQACEREIEYTPSQALSQTVRENGRRTNCLASIPFALLHNLPQHK
jgi:hypothetical protein